MPPTPTPTPATEAAMADERSFLHELATPLSTLTLLAEAYCETAPEEDRKRADQIKRIADRLNELLRARRELLISRSPRG